MHTQIDLLRQAVLDLRKDATNRSVRDQKNTENIKRKLGELEKLSHLSTAQPQSTAEMQLDTMETRMQALEQRPYLVRSNPFPTRDVEGKRRFSVKHKQLFVGILWY